MVKADVVFAGGYSLWEAKRRQHFNVHSVPSSVDIAHFAPAREALPECSDQASIGHPRLGFFGVIDERFDIEWVNELATLRPDWQIVLIGPVVKIDPATLPRRPNVHYLGPKGYAELPAYLSGWDVALMPFAINESTRFSYEFPCADGDPYYPIPRQEKTDLHNRYKALADDMSGVTFLGRLATYKYYNMDQVVGQALAFYPRIELKVGLDLVFTKRLLNDARGAGVAAQVIRVRIGNIFNTFLMAGYECTAHRRSDGQRLELLATTGHATWPDKDYQQLGAMGIGCVRDGLRWHLIESRPGRYDWSSFLPMLRAARDRNVQVVWGLCHYAYSDGLDIWRPGFVDRFARFAGAAAKLMKDEGVDVPFYSPINEISFWS